MFGAVLSMRRKVWNSYLDCNPGNEEKLVNFTIEQIRLASNVGKALEKIEQRIVYSKDEELFRLWDVFLIIYKILTTYSGLQRRRYCEQLGIEIPVEILEAVETTDELESMWDSVLTSLDSGLVPYTDFIRLSTFTSVIAILTVIRLVACIYIQEPMNICPVLSPVALWNYSHRRFSQSAVAVRIYSYRRSQSDRESQQHYHASYIIHHIWRFCPRAGI